MCCLSDSSSASAADAADDDRRSGICLCGMWWILLDLWLCV